MIASYLIEQMTGNDMFVTLSANYNDSEIASFLKWNKKKR